MATGELPRGVEVICPDTPIVDLTPEPTIDRGIAGGGTGDLQPRPIESIDVDQPEPALVTAILDLNGDGRMELVVDSDILPRRIDKPVRD